jgi:hypothetical protein
VNNNVIDVLNKECTVFCRYLINETSNSYILNKYREGHEANPGLQASTAEPFDRLLVQIASKSPFYTSLVDKFTSIFSRFSIFRKKLVFLLAILESCSPTHRNFDFADGSGRPLLLLKMVRKSILFIFVLMLAILIITPLRFMPSASRMFIK